MTVLDVVGGFRGPCGLCGGPDARHRVADAIVARVHAGEHAGQVAEDYGLPLSAVERLCHEWPAEWRGQQA